MKQEQAVLRGDNVGFWRGGRCLFEALSFELAPGQLGLVTGPNGSGKTTLLRAAAGLTPPTHGRISWCSSDVQSLAPEQRGEIAYRGHLDGLKKDLSVTENLAFHKALWRGAADAGPLLETLQLGHAGGLHARHLSAGQRRRAALAALRVSGARLWILDEPATSLDRQGRGVLTGWIREHLVAGGTALVATHQPEQLVAPGVLLIEL